jgi:hypothetical protein
MWGQPPALGFPAKRSSAALVIPHLAHPSLYLLFVAGKSSEHAIKLLKKIRGMRRLKDDQSILDDEMNLVSSSQA